MSDDEREPGTPAGGAPAGGTPIGDAAETPSAAFEMGRTSDSGADSGADAEADSGTSSDATDDADRDATEGSRGDGLDGDGTDGDGGPGDGDGTDSGDGMDGDGTDDDGRDDAPGRPPRVRLGAASGILTAVVIAVLVVVNVLGTRVNRSFDLTANHAHTLSASTLKVLHELTHPVHIYAFLQSGSSQAAQIQSLLTEYTRAGGGKLQVQVVDPTAQPALAEQYGVVEYNDVVVVSGNSHDTATPADIFSTDPATGAPVFDGESAVTNAILRAAHPQHLTVDFVQGHNEQQTGSAYTLVQEAVTGAGYTVGSLNLLTQSVPKATAAVILAGPQHDLAPAEITALQNYALGGGHLFVLLDPLGGAGLPRVYGLLHTFGVQARNDLVVDPAANRHFQTQAATLVPQIDAQSITNPLLQANIPVLLPASLSLTPVAGQKTYTVTPLLVTSSSAYAKTKLPPTSTGFDSKTDVKGPFDLGVAVTSTVKGNAFRMVVLGSSTFALNSFFNTIQGNHDLFLNSLAWLTGQSAQIRIQPIKALQNTVVLTSASMRGLLYGFVVLLPLLALGGAFAIWSWRRRL